MISLRKSGSIGINRLAMEEHFEDVHGAIMYYDEDDNRVGIERRDDPDDDAAYTISRTNETGSIVPIAFLREYDLIPEVTTQYEPKVETINQNLELVTFDLDEPIGTYGSPDDEGQESKDEEE